ncbi:chromate transporter [Lacticigenium naphthae]|uniref:chromate transporter n=1 Tax=Lacticigenium naphthae TaxID=515351 RepID=UPI000427351B|nr:chromate transporter [Lacticigenium naphthae]
MIGELINLFMTFLKIGLLSIGGGYAIIPLIQESVVASTGWITVQEFTEIITISQMTPGSLAINISTFIGMKIAGIMGALVSTIGAILFGTLFSILLFNFFGKHKNIASIANVLKGLRATSIGLIASSALTIALTAFWESPSINTDVASLNLSGLFIFSLSFILLYKYKANPLAIIALTGIIGLYIY